MKSIIFLLVLMAYVTPVRCATGGSPEKGLELLLDKAYLPADLDQEVFDALWTVSGTVESEGRAGVGGGATADGHGAVRSSPSS